MSVAWVGAGIAATGVVGSLISSGNAADAQQQATQQSLAEQQREFDITNSQNQPFLTAGTGAVNQLAQLTQPGGYTSQQFKFDPSQLASDPGYQYTLQQGQNALDRRQAAGGTFYSGGGLQAASALNQGLASTEFNDAYNRQNNAFQTARANVLNPLQSLAGQGQTAANTSAANNSNYASNVSNLLTGNANAQGAAGISASNSINSGLSNGLAAWQRQQLIGSLGSGGSSANSLYTGTASNYVNPGYDPYAIGSN